MGNKMGYEKKGDEWVEEVLERYRKVVEGRRRGGVSAARGMTPDERSERARKGGKAGGRGRK